MTFRLLLLIVLVLINSCRSRVNQRESRLGSGSIASLKEGALAAAKESLKSLEAAGEKTVSSGLKDDMSALERYSGDAPQPPSWGGGFFPAMPEVEQNPYLESTYAWAEAYLSKAESFPEIGKSVSTSSFPQADYSKARDLGRELERLSFLVLHPESRLRFHSELTTRLLTRIYVASYDYLRYGGTKLGIPASTPHALDDWFAMPALLQSLRLVDKGLGPLIPNSLRQVMRQAARKAGGATAAIPLPTLYANRDLSYAEILVQASIYLDVPEWRTKADTLVKKSVDSMYEDGAFPYLGQQNECVNYHAGNILSLARYYAATGDPTALAGLNQGHTYEALTIEPGPVSEYYTAPAWKTMWNGNHGIDGAEPVVFASKDPILRGIIDRLISARGAAPSPVLATFYSPQAAQDSPDHYLVYDRNIQGPRGRFGKFSLGFTGRNVHTENETDPGLNTLAGAMLTQQKGEQSVLAAALLSVYPRVQLELPVAGNEWEKSAYLRGKLQSQAVIARTSAAYAGTSLLQSQMTGPAARTQPWQSDELWLALEDRIIGVVAVGAEGTQAAYGISGRIKLGAGRTPANVPAIETLEAGKRYLYGGLEVLIHEHNFKNVSVATAGIVRDEYPLATEIRLSDRDSTTQSRQNYAATDRFYFVVEIRPQGSAEAVVQLQQSGDIWRLTARTPKMQVSAFYNRGKSPGEGSIGSSFGTLGSIHFSMSTGQSPVSFSPAPVNIPAQGSVLVVQSSDETDHLAGWINFPAMVARP